MLRDGTSGEQYLCQGMAQVAKATASLFHTTDRSVGGAVPCTVPIFIPYARKTGVFPLLALTTDTGAAAGVAKFPWSGMPVQEHGSQGVMPFLVFL